ncbi:MAG: hypothetical protein KF813_01250 [Trueperaceae bacterium]|nr:hypothetical protein [Trueperaceae bacterium]
MFRKLLLASAVLAIVGFGFAQTAQPQSQTFYINPTTVSGADAIAKGATTASVNQTVDLILPQATALHLDASHLTFDLTLLDGSGWSDRASSWERPEGFNLACVYSAGPDVSTGLGNDYWGQTQVVPGGIAYQINGAGSFPTVSVTGVPVVNYPPLMLDSQGELVPGSKDYFVCYQSFIIQLFSNFSFWDLQVVRNDAPNTQSIEHLYIQGNVCSDFGAGTGLFALDNNPNRIVHLIPKSLLAGTTGDRVNANCGNTNTSWLDILGVMAVKINSDNHGTSSASLTYTLASSDTRFE